MNYEKQHKKIIFFDSVLRVERFIREKEGRKLLERSDTVCIAMNPKVRSYLLQKNLQTDSTLPYFTDNSRTNAFEKSKVLLGWIEKKIDLLDADGALREACKNWTLFLIRFNINSCLWILEIIINAVAVHQPEILLVSSHSEKSVSSVYIEPEEGYLDHCVRAVAREKNIAYKTVPEYSNSSTRIPTIPFIPAVQSTLRLIFQYGRFQIWEKVSLCKKVLNRKKSTILFTTRLYNMKRLAGKLCVHSPNDLFYFLDGPVTFSFYSSNNLMRLLWKRYSHNIKSQMAVFENLEESIKNEKTLFSYGAVSLTELITKKIRNCLAPYIIGQSLWSYKLDQCITALQPAAIFSNGNRVDDISMAELSRQKNIPSILISHGSFVRPKDEFERVEWGEHGRVFLRAPFSIHALQSPLAEEYFKDFPTSSERVKTGPLIWGTPVDKKKSLRLRGEIFGKAAGRQALNIVLHAGTSKASNIMRFHVYETPDEYIQALCDIARAVEKIEGCVFVIKFRPTSEISIGDLKRLVPFSKKVILSTKEPFKDVLGMSNLLVSFSSTTIEEALQNRIPVLLYGGNGRYQHISAYEITAQSEVRKSAVYHTRGAQDVEYAVREILNKRIDSVMDKHLFDQYIYAPSERASLVDILKDKRVKK